MRAVLLIVSDTHGGHKLALCNPDVTLYDESEEGQLVPYEPELTAFQQVLYRMVTERIVPQAAQMAGGDPLYMLHLGDPTHGNKHPSQVMTTRLADQIEIAVANYDLFIPQLPTLLAVRGIAGTGAHEFEEASATILVMKQVAERYKDIDIRPLYHGLLDIDGCAIDYSHHGPGGGRRIWLAGNEARFYLRDLMLNEIVSGRRPAALYLRGHTHVKVNEVISMDTGGGEVESRLIVCPSMCGLGDFARQVTRSVPVITVGAVLIEIIDGQPRAPLFITETFDLRTRERL